MIEMYKLTHGMYNYNPDLIVKFRDKSILRTGLRGHKYMIDKIFINSKIKKHFLSNRIANLWNSMPEKVVNSFSINNFKNNLDKLWVNLEVVYDCTRSIDSSLYSTYT